MSSINYKDCTINFVQSLRIKTQDLVIQIRGNCISTLCLKEPYLNKESISISSYLVPGNKIQIYIGRSNYSCILALRLMVKLLLEAKQVDITFLYPLAEEQDDYDITETINLIRLMCETAISIKRK